MPEALEPVIDQLYDSYDASISLMMVQHDGPIKYFVIMISVKTIRF